MFADAIRLWRWGLRVRLDGNTALVYGYGMDMGGRGVLQCGREGIYHHRVRRRAERARGCVCGEVISGRGR